MNVRNPRKRVPTARGRKNKNISNLPAEPLSGSNSIPKQHVGTDQTNQLQFDQEIDRIISPISNQQTDTNQIGFNVIPTAYFCVDENPFDLLSEDLFDTSLSEDDELNQPETNEEIVRTPPEEVHQFVENNPDFEEMQEEEYEEDSLQDEHNIPRHKKTNACVDEKVKNHPLSPILQKWTEQNRVSATYKSQANKFIEFLAGQEVQDPTKEHIILFYDSLQKDPKIKGPGHYLSAIRAFFRWTAEAGLYKNITIGTEYQLVIKMRSYKTQSRRNADKEQEISNLNNKGQNKTPISKVIITTHDMVAAKFLPTQAKYLINNDLVVFKRWIETLNAGVTNNRKKGWILRFAYFLHSENRTTPTQQDIIDYYKNNLSHFSIDMVNKNMISIRNFFSWTAEQTIYPNIAINTYPVNRKPINADDIPILPDKMCMKPIPNPTEPLINKTV